jgi:hypothetical protein
LVRVVLTTSTAREGLRFGLLLLLIVLIVLLVLHPLFVVRGKLPGRRRVRGMLLRCNGRVLNLLQSN